MPKRAGESRFDFSRYGVQRGAGVFSFAEDEFDNWQKGIEKELDLFRRLVAVDTLLRACVNVEKPTDAPLEEVYETFVNRVGHRIADEGIFHIPYGGRWLCRVALPPSGNINLARPARRIRIAALATKEEAAVVYGNNGEEASYREFAAVIDPAQPRQAANIYFQDCESWLQTEPKSVFIANLLIDELKSI